MAVEPGDADAPAVEQAEPREDEGAGADANQRRAPPRRLAQVVLRFEIELRPGLQQAANDHDIVEGIRIDEAGVGRDLKPAARPHRPAQRTHHRPGAKPLPRTVAFVGGEAERVDEIGEGGQREAVSEDEAHPQPDAVGSCPEAFGRQNVSPSPPSMRGTSIQPGVIAPSAPISAPTAGWAARRQFGAVAEPQRIIDERSLAGQRLDRTIERRERGIDAAACERHMLGAQPDGPSRVTNPPSPICL